MCALICFCDLWQYSKLVEDEESSLQKTCWRRLALMVSITSQILQFLWCNVIHFKLLLARFEWSRFVLFQSFIFVAAGGT